MAKAGGIPQDLPTMELGAIEARLRAAGDALDRRLVRLYDGLEHLASTTRILLERT